MRVVIERIGITVLIWGSLFFHVHANTAENILLNEVRQGELLLKADHPGQYTSAVMGATDVDIVITGAIARVRVTQYFNNPHPQWMEGTYAFPLPDQSAVDQMNMVIGDRLIKGVIKEKQEARKSYDQAKQAGKSASIIEQISPNIFTTAVANIPPEGEVRVEIEYQQKLSWRDGAFSINFPTAITPRYLPQELINRGEQREIHALNQEWTLLPLAITDHESDYGNSGETLSAEEYPLKTSDSVKNRTPPTNITIKLNAGFPLAQLFSRYHPVSVNRVLNGDGTVTQVVRLDASNHTSKHDFELVWLPKAGNAPQAVFFTEQHGEEQYGLLMVMPPSLKHETQSPPREVTFVIDTSGSMDGPSIAQAKSALRSALARLEAEDSFNIIAFNSESSALLGQPLAATPEALHIADYFISKLEAGGGTEMMGALKMALANPGLGKKEETRKRRLQQVVFITDGAVGNEAELFRYVHNHLGDRRLFTVGIGSAPNSYFMRKSAQFGRGSYTVIGDIKGYL